MEVQLLFRALLLLFAHTHVLASLPAPAPSARGSYDPPAPSPRAYGTGRLTTRRTTLRIESADADAVRHVLRVVAVLRQPHARLLLAVGSDGVFTLLQGCSTWP